MAVCPPADSHESQDGPMAMPRKQWMCILSAAPLLAWLTACSSYPEFTVKTAPNTDVGSFQHVAFDPRELAWFAEGLRPVPTGTLKAQVREAMEQRGYRFAAPESAEIWIEVIALSPDRNRAEKGRPRPAGREGDSPAGKGGQGGSDKAGDPPSSYAPPSETPGHGIPEGEVRERTLMVRLVQRETLQDLWTSAVHLPARWNEPTSTPSILHKLLAPLPPCKASTPPIPSSPNPGPPIKNM